MFQIEQIFVEQDPEGRLIYHLASASVLVGIGSGSYTMVGEKWPSKFPY